MKTTTINLYQFSELSEQAKKRAKDDHRSACGYSWASEALDSMKAFYDKLGVKILDYCIYWESNYNSSIKLDYYDPDEVVEQVKGIGDLTGVCFDIPLIEGAKDGNLLNAFYALMKYCADDYEAQYEDEEFSDMSDANDYWYTEDGKLW